MGAKRYEMKSREDRANYHGDYARQLRLEL